MNSYKYTVIDLSTDKETGFKAIVPSFPNLYIVADSITQLHDVVQDFIQEEIKYRKSQKKTIPTPDAFQKETGVFTTRVPAYLHSRISELAKSKGLSMNKYVTELLEKGLTVA